MARFRNPHIQDTRRTLWDAILWKMGRYNDPIPRLSPSPQFFYPASPEPFNTDLPGAVWIGHSTFLIEAEGVAFLTDPIWEDYCSPVPIRALKRHHEPPILLGDLPSLDFVLISHNHYDHLDAKTVANLFKIQPDILWIVPLKLKSWFERRGIKKVVELNWWETHKTPKCSITAVPAQHFSGRSFWDKNATFWNGYVCETERKRVYFTGDTGYNDRDFKKIGNAWPSMDLSLIPIGTYVPRRFMQPVHCSPWEAVEIHCDVRSRFSLGMHWKTFCLSGEPMDRPPYDLYLAMNHKKCPYETFLPIDPGIYVNW